MTTEENKAIARRIYEEVLNQGEITLVDALIDTHFLDHTSPPEAPQGPEPFREFTRNVRAAFPDGVFTVEDLIAEGDKVVIRYSFRGTHQREFWGLPPSGKRLRMDGISIARFVGGKVIEHWGNNNFPGVQE